MPYIGLTSVMTIDLTTSQQGRVSRHTLNLVDVCQGASLTLDLSRMLNVGLPRSCDSRTTKARGDDKADMPPVTPVIWVIL